MGPEGLWSSGRVDLTPWNPTSSSADRMNLVLSQSLSNINLSQDIGPQIHRISQLFSLNMLRHTQDMGCFYIPLYPHEMAGLTPRHIICWLHQYISCIPLNPMKSQSKSIRDWSQGSHWHLPKLLGHEPSSCRVRDSCSAWALDPRVVNQALFIGNN